MENLNDKEKQELEKLRKQHEKKLKRQNEYASANYDRIAFVLPKGSREKIREYYREKGLESLADIFKYLLKQDGFVLDGENEQNTPDFGNMLFM